jgi:hypothetical protein
LNRGFSADGAGDGGTIRLLGAKIGSRLNCGGATLRNSSGPALAADGMQTDGNVLLHKRFTAEGVGERGTIRLLGVHIGGQIDCRDSMIISNSNPLERWVLDGLTYSEIPQIDSADCHREAWLELLRTATPVYTAQPYQQLATVYRSIGHDSDVRAILIAQRDHQLERGALTRRSDRWQARLSRILLGYGYQPWRALLYLAGLFTVSAILAVVLGAHGALARTPAQNLPPVHTAAQPLFADSEPCTLVQTIGKGLDLGTPFLPASQIGNGSCEITTNPTGEALTISRWVLQLAAWALAALFVVGFTGLVRKT